MRRFPLFAISLVLFLACMIPGIAQAARVEVSWSEADPATAELNKAQAMSKGLALAVAREAMTVLPDRLTDARRILMERFLEPITQNFVVNVTELQVLPFGDGKQAVLEVTVNRQTLAQWLRQAGVYYTVTGPMPYDLQLMNSMSDQDFENLGSLQALSGLDPVEGAEIRLVLYRNAEGFRATLTTPTMEFGARNADLADLWFDLWGKFFADMGGRTDMAGEVTSTPTPEGEAGLEAGATPGPEGAQPMLPPAKNMAGQGDGNATLADNATKSSDDLAAYAPAGGDSVVVSGWADVEGVYALDQAMQEWGGVVSDVRLGKVTLGSNGMMAIWNVRVISAEGLRQKLNSFAAGKGLTVKVMAE